MKDALIAIGCTALMFALITFYLFIIKPYQDAKNQVKQERKERDEVDKLLEEYPTHFYRSKRDYEDFDLTEIAATSL